MSGPYNRCLSSFFATAFSGLSRFGRVWFVVRTEGPALSKDFPTQNELMQEWDGLYWLLHTMVTLVKCKNCWVMAFAFLRCIMKINMGGSLWENNSERSVILRIQGNIAVQQQQGFDECWETVFSTKSGLLSANWWCTVGKPPFHWMSSNLLILLYPFWLLFFLQIGVTERWHCNIMHTVYWHRFLVVNVGLEWKFEP